MFYSAIALNSAENVGRLLQQLERHRTTATLVICLDNDKKGRERTATITAGLQQLQICYMMADICNGYKDPNEAFVQDRDAFMAAVARAQRQAPAKPHTSRVVFVRGWSGRPG